MYADLVASLAKSPLVGADTIVIIEYPIELGTLPPTLADGRLVGVRNRRYGRTVLGMYIADPTGRLGCEERADEFLVVNW